MKQRCKSQFQNQLQIETLEGRAAPSTVLLVVFEIEEPENPFVKAFQEASLENSTFDQDDFDEALQAYYDALDAPSKPIKSITLIGPEGVQKF